MKKIWWATYGIFKVWAGVTILCFHLILTVMSIQPWTLHSRNVTFSREITYQSIPVYRASIGSSIKWIGFISVLVLPCRTPYPIIRKIHTREQGGVGGDGKNPIITKSCLDAIKVKHQKWLKYKYCMTSSNYSNYKSARNKVTSELCKAKYNQNTTTRKICLLE